MSAKSRKWWVLGTVCFGLFMINLDGNVVNLAMPTIVKDFHASLSQLEWISNAYLLTFAVFLITLGRLGDGFGRKRMFLGGLAVFTLGSALCGFAANVSQLILARVVQGIGGSAMMPATLSLLAANFAPEERGRAMGFWGAVSGLAFILGPIVGGYLTQSGLGATINGLLGMHQLWRYVFFVNLPFGVAAFGLGLAVIPESRDADSRRRLDVPGVVLASLAVFLVVYGFIEGPRLGWWWSRKPLQIAGLQIGLGELSVVPVLFGLAVVFGAAFLLYERKRTIDPLVDLSLFRSHNYSLGMVVGLILNFALMGAMFLLPLFFQAVLGISPVRTGTLLLPFALALLVASPLAGMASDRLDPKYILVAGLVIMAAADILMARFRVDTRPAEMIVPFIVMGIGMGFSMTPLTNLTLYGVPATRVGGASGLVSTTRQIGAVMGIAIFGVILQAGMTDSIGGHAAEIPNLPPAARDVLVRYVSEGGLYGTSESGPDGLGAQMAAAMGATTDGAASAAAALFAGIEKALKASFTDSINRTFVAACLFGVVGVAAGLLLRRMRRGPADSPVSTVAAAAPSEQDQPALVGLPVAELPQQPPATAQTLGSLR